MREADPNLLLWVTLLALAEQATRDPLTGLYNRRFFEETLADHIAVAQRYDHPLSLVLFDIDRLKQINDTQGHLAGDNALKQFAELLKSTARKADIVCRYGGDEFAIILPETGKSAAASLVNRVIQGLHKHNGNLSATVGIAALPCDDLVAEADTDLLTKKRAFPRSQNQ